MTLVMTNAMEGDSVVAYKREGQASAVISLLNAILKYQSVTQCPLRDLEVDDFSAVKHLLQELIHFESVVDESLEQPDCWSKESVEAIRLLVISTRAIFRDLGVERSVAPVFAHFMEHYNANRESYERSLSHKWEWGFRGDRWIRRSEAEVLQSQFDQRVPIWHHHISFQLITEDDFDEDEINDLVHAARILAVPVRQDKELKPIALFEDVVMFLQVGHEELRNIGKAVHTIWGEMLSKLEDSTVAPNCPPPAPQKSPTVFVPTEFQNNILRTLNGIALKKQPLADKVCNGEASRFYKPGGLQELRSAGLVKHRNGLGFYRPDAPPKGTVVLSNDSSEPSAPQISTGAT